MKRWVWGKKQLYEYVFQNTIKEKQLSTTQPMLSSVRGLTCGCGVWFEIPLIHHSRFDDIDGCGGGGRRQPGRHRGNEVIVNPIGEVRQQIIFSAVVHGQLHT